MKIRVWLVSGALKKIIDDSKGCYVRWDTLIHHQPDLDKHYYDTDNIFDPVLTMIAQKYIDYMMLEIDDEHLIRSGIYLLGDSEVVVEHLRFSEIVKCVTSDGFFSRIYCKCFSLKKMRKAFSLISTIPLANGEENSEIESSDSSEED